MPWQASSQQTLADNCPSAYRSRSALWRGVRAGRHVHRQLHVWCGVDYCRVVARGVHKGLAGRVIGYEVLAR